MEKLQEVIVNKIIDILNSGKKDIPLLDVLNRLLGTVSTFLINKKTIM